MQIKSSIVLIYIVCLLTQTALCKTITVGSSHNINALHQALELASSGDTVMVNAGIYREGNFTINKSIVFKGINNPVLDGENKYEIP